MEREPAPKTVGLILNTALPSPQGTISRELVQFIKEFSNFPEHISIHEIDLASLDLPMYDASYPERLSEDEQQRVKTWRSEASRHSAYIFLFPLFTWSHTNPIKNAVHHLSPAICQRKPTLLVTFAREDTRPWEVRVEKPGHIPRESTSMMEEFLVGKGFNMMKPKREYFRWPKFDFFWDIWDSADAEDRSPCWPGGNQDEVWENPAWNHISDWTREVGKVLEKVKRR